MLDELERVSIRGRDRDITAFIANDVWVYAISNENDDVFQAWLLEPEGGQGWTVVIDAKTDLQRMQWGRPQVIGIDFDLTYSEAWQVAYAFLTEGAIDFELHRGVVLNSHLGANTLTVCLSEIHDNGRTVVCFQSEGVYYGKGYCETWNPQLGRFERVKGSEIRFPEANYCLHVEDVVDLARDWLVEGLFEDAEVGSKAA